MNSSTINKATHTPQECKISCDFEILRNSQLFRSSNTDMVKLFAYLAKRKKYQRGDAMIAKGKEASQAFLLLSGEVEITTLHKGKEVIVQRLEEGAFFGELALLASFKWFFNARAKTDCEVMTIDQESFDKVLEKHPEKRRGITERIVQFRVARLTEQTEFMLDLIPEERLEETRSIAPSYA